MDKLPTLTFITDHSGNILYQNKVTSSVGDKEKLKGTVFEVLHPNYYKQMKDVLNKKEQAEITNIPLLMHAPMKLLNVQLESMIDLDHIKQGKANVRSRL
jgi:hypothetical protein